MKMALIISSITFLVLTGCDQPRQTRGYARGTATSALESSPVSNNTGTPTATPTAVPTVIGGVTIPAEISHCSWSQDGTSGFASNHSHVGAYTLCKSSVDETDVSLQVSNNISDSQICLFPTSSDSSSSFYIGEARCLMVSDNKKIYKIKMYKNRPGFESKSMTGMMMMKDKAFFYPAPFYQYVLSPDAYLYCSNWLAIYKDQSYCVAFKSVGQYTYHQF